MEWSKGRSAIEGMLPEAPVKVTLNLHGSADRVPRRGVGSIGIRRVRAQAGSPDRHELALLSPGSSA